IREEEYDNEAAAIQSFDRFLSLKEGDYVAVNNTNAGLFGIGIIRSGYKFERRKHSICDPDNPNAFYPHFRDVEWVKTAYMPRSAIVSEGDTGWQPYGTVGKVYSQNPAYISRIIAGARPQAVTRLKALVPTELQHVIRAVNDLRKERNHMERAHES